MKVNTETTIEFDKDERDMLVDAARLLDNVFGADINCVIQFDVEKRNIIDPDDIACMIRTLITLSDAGESIKGFLEV